jgi:hypothetical protein
MISITIGMMLAFSFQVKQDTKCVMWNPNTTRIRVVAEFFDPMDLVHQNGRYTVHDGELQSQSSGFIRRVGNFHDIRDGSVMLVWALDPFYMKCYD